MKVRISSRLLTTIGYNTVKKTKSCLLRKVVLVYSFFILTMGAAKATGNDFYINARIKGLPAGLEVTLTDFLDDDAKPIATAKTYLGGFKIHKTIKEPIIIEMVIGENIKEYIFLEPGVLKVEGLYSKNEITYSGMPSQNDFEYCMTTLLGIKDSILKALDDKANKEDENEGSVNLIRQFLKTKINDFLETRKDSLSSSVCLLFMAGAFESQVDIEPCFKGLSKEVKESRYGLLVASHIEKAKIAAVGSMAVDFELKDSSGNVVHLSDYKGKYVLLDFWASWCGPCRLENPYVVEAYNIYHSKNFEILSISLDKVRQDWIDAIKEDRLNWQNASDLMSWDSPVAKLYGVESIPTNFLIDPSGKIIAKKLREFKLLEALRTKLK